MSELKSHVRIRAALPGELDRIGELTAEIYLGDGYVTAGDPYLRRLRDAASRAAEAELLVGLIDGEPAGTVTFCPYGSPWANIAGPGEAEFRMLGVSPAARGRGLGERLVRHCIARAREEGCAALRLSTAPVMYAAHRVYHRLGFVRTPDLDWSPVAGLDPLLTYALPL